MWVWPKPGMHSMSNTLRCKIVVICSETSTFLLSENQLSALLKTSPSLSPSKLVLDVTVCSYKIDLSYCTNRSSSQNHPQPAYHVHLNIFSNIQMTHFCITHMCEYGQPHVSPSARWHWLQPPATLSNISSLENGWLSLIRRLTALSAFQCDVTPHQCSEDAFPIQSQSGRKWKYHWAVLFIHKDPAVSLLWSAFCPHYAHTC